jgi:RNA polymerase sigma-70 factor, ECF subfamily
VQLANDDATILARARTGDRAAFATIVRTQQSSVFSLALRMLKQRQAAEDLAQDVFLQLYRKLESIESSQHLGFWLRRVTANLAIDRLRQAPRLGLISSDDAPEVAAEVHESDHWLSQELSRLIDSLTPPARAVLLLRYQEDMDPTDIANALDMPINTVKSHLKRALDALRTQVVSGGAILQEDLRHG